MERDLHIVQPLGVERDRSVPDGPTVRVNVDSTHRRSNGVVHRSAIHGPLDSVMDMHRLRAAGRRPVATAEISVRFLRPVFEGRLAAVGRAPRAGERFLADEAERPRGDGVTAAARGHLPPGAARAMRGAGRESGTRMPHCGVAPAVVRRARFFRGSRARCDRFARHFHPAPVIRLQPCPL